MVTIGRIRAKKRAPWLIFHALSAEFPQPVKLPQGVSDVPAELARAVDGDFSGHSLRRGFITNAAKKNPIELVPVSRTLT